MKVGFVSLGCAKNLVDSENIIALFDDPFFEYEYDLKQCEIILINTCGFILSAKEEAIDTILEIAEYKKDKLKKLIVKDFGWLRQPLHLLCDSFDQRQLSFLSDRRSCRRGKNPPGKRREGTQYRCSGYDLLRP